MDVSKARAQAARCRRLANTILDQQASRALIELAEEYEQTVASAEPVAGCDPTAASHSVPAPTG